MFCDKKACGRFLTLPKHHPLCAFRVPYHMQELLMKMKAARNKFMEQHNRAPSDEEMAAQLKVGAG
jgi:hypothetical protein